MTKLSELHNAQINMMVCKKLGLGLSSYARNITQDDASILLDDNKTLVDYCNNWSDAGPIIVEHRIGIIPAPENGKWRAAHRKTGDDNTPYHFTQHKNPLRAAMIVFLEMQ